MIPLTRHGRRELLLCSLLLAALSAGTVVGGVRLWPGLLAGLLPVGAVWVWVVWFFRDPERATPQDPAAFVAPADGRVADITPLGPDNPLGEPGLRIGIFMSIFNVHVNRMPCDGRVVDVEHQPGAFLDARDPHAAERNESTTITLRCCKPDATVIVRQVAGLLARRIVTDLAPEQSVRAGQRFGMIKFGSRLEMLLPESLDCEVCVEPGQPVRAGETVLARLRQRKAPHA